MKATGPASSAAPAPTSPAPAGARRRDLCTGIALALLCFLVYNANFRTVSAGDTYPARYLPFVLLRDHTLFFDKMAATAMQGYSPAFWIVRGRGGHAVSLYPVVAPVLVTPLYLPAVHWLNAAGWTPPHLDLAARLMEKLSASLIASLSAALLYLLLRRRADARTALLLTIACALGTNTWMIGSQALWQHGMGELLLILCLLLITGPCTLPRAFAAGITCALIPFNRPPDALLAAALGGWALLGWAGRRGAVPLIAGALAAALPLLAYNLAAAGNIVGAYAIERRASFFGFALLPGLAGLLFSPGRGLFVFTPFLLFLPFGLRHAFRDPRTRLLSIFISIAIVLQLLAYAKADWRAGNSWGPRWLTDILPLLVWLLAPFAAGMGRLLRAAFIAAVAASIAIQAVGAFWYTGSSDATIMADVTGGQSQFDAAWDIRNIPFLSELGHPPASRELLHDSGTGFIDSIKAGGREAGTALPGTPLTVEGWALADGHTPAAVALTLFPGEGTKWVGNRRFLFGYPAAQTLDFGPRPDVDAAIHNPAPCGWRIVLPTTTSLAPGKYLLELSVQESAGAESRPVTRCDFEILPAPSAAAITDPMLGDLAREAAARLRADQQPPGYWLTSYTTSPHFKKPRQEMNTFLTSMLTDLLAPVAKDTGLADSLDRARAHLAAQIEPGGLVRYHGLPDSPTIPALGVVITPDTDDTALVWRITGGKAPLLPGVLETLDTYRTPEGLYRTWLAPREAFLNIDPGADPNPPDIAIQMHLLMFLAQAQPAGARALYTALQGAIAQDRLWVYYQQTPLIPILRQADLAAMGYPLTLPQSHLQTPVPGQQPWLAACRLLAQYETYGTAANTGDNKVTPPPGETRALLKTLAGDNFAILRDTPPLLYHNDLTAHTRRYYWSADFGYALWLRLYHESTRPPGPAQ